MAGILTLCLVQESEGQQKSMAASSIRDIGNCSTYSLWHRWLGRPCTPGAMLIFLQQQTL